MKTQKKTHEIIRQCFSEANVDGHNNSKERLKKINKLMYQGYKAEDAKKTGLHKLMSHSVRLDRSLSGVAAKAASSSLLLVVSDPAQAANKQVKDQQRMLKNAKLNQDEEAKYPGLRWMWNFRIGDHKEVSREEIRKKLQLKKETTKDQYVELKRIENQIKASGPLEYLRPGWVEVQKADHSKMNTLAQWRRLSVT